jgi:hypothetical protein
MTIAVELKPEEAPGGVTEMAEVKLLIDEVKVVVEALAGIIFQKGVSRRFVVPRFIARA